ncbi:carbohydrate kinase [Pseudoxanthomonas daejeonensis]|uniref:carbohydrate kinase family protein n=1 Tax=Pseudoxanthomonas daejeonensis TaxID=266062 RepID=UPI001F53EAFB|nr:carbohydrate kinase [Pseudoxanthomonas daejeonensis]UNK58625.1 carbohydrate kinase [Pseudoxanthomonas daejeonensis]
MYLVCGEALFDVFAQGERGDVLELAARPGGSPFNVAIGLTRLGHRAGLLAGLSTDVLGRRLRNVLVREGVCLDYIIDKPHRTTVVLVALDGDGVPQYSFYGDGCADREIVQSELPTLGDRVEGLHFGSYTLVTDPTASAYFALAEQQRGRRLISLDPNVRATVEPDMQVWRDRVTRWRQLADLVKVSEEDLALLHPGMEVDEIAQAWLQSPVQVLVVTRGGGGALGYTAHARVELPASEVAVVDTVGAGDSFQAALLSCLPDRSALREASTSPQRLQQVLAYATRAAGITCTREGANPPYAQEMA